MNEKIHAMTTLSTGWQETTEHFILPNQDSLFFIVNFVFLRFFNIRTDCTINRDILQLACAWPSSHSLNLRIFSVMAA